MSETFDLAFHWDPMCPFAWLTSLWMDQVIDQRGLNVDWRFISLRILNADVDYETEFPPEYIEGHGAGLRLLRVAAAVRDAEGPAPMRPLYKAMSAPLFECPPPTDNRTIPPAAEPDRVRALLTACGLSADYADALSDDRWDAHVEADTEQALADVAKIQGQEPVKLVNKPLVDLSKK